LLARFILSRKTLYRKYGKIGLETGNNKSRDNGRLNFSHATADNYALRIITMHASVQLQGGLHSVCKDLFKSVYAVSIC